MRQLVVAYLNSLRKGELIRLKGLYPKLYSFAPIEFDALGFTSGQRIERKWVKDIRWGLQDAKNQGLVKHVGLPKSGTWQRI